MQIKRYEAATLQEAMMKIKNDLGPEAVVLSTSRIRRGKGSLFEVTAARDGNSVSQSAGQPQAGNVKRSLPEAPIRQDDVASLRREIAELKSLIVGFQDQRLLYDEFAELKDTLGELLSAAGFRMEGRADGPWMRIYQHLIASGISRPKAWKILQAAREETGGRMTNLEGGFRAAAAVVRRAIRIPAAQEKKSRVKVLIGPTGVGKTTTVAKLAAHYSLERKMKVGLVTMDTYRIAAAEQLKVYADIMGIPLSIAPEKTALRKAMSRFADFDLVLVDTPGKGRLDMEYMTKLGDAMKEEALPEKHLLVSLTSNSESILDSAMRFEPFQYDHVILTKADECRRFGFLCDVIERIGKPVSFVTNGQSVPQDIEKADPEKLAGLIVHGNVH